MRGGRNRAGQGLSIDVGQVVHGLADFFEHRPRFGQTNARAERCFEFLRIVTAQSGDAIEHDEMSVGWHEPRE